MAVTKKENISEILHLIKEIKNHVDDINLDKDKFHSQMNAGFKRDELNMVRRNLNKAMDSFGYIYTNTHL